MNPIIQFPPFLFLVTNLHLHRISNKLLLGIGLVIHLLHFHICSIAFGQCLFPLRLVLV